MTDIKRHIQHPPIEARYHNLGDRFGRVGTISESRRVPRGPWPFATDVLPHRKVSHRREVLEDGFVGNVADELISPIEEEYSSHKVNREDLESDAAIMCVFARVSWKKTANKEEKPEGTFPATFRRERLIPLGAT